MGDGGEVEIKITMSNDVYRRIRSAVAVRGLSGMDGGLADSFLFKVFDALEKGERELKLEKVKEG